MSSDPPHPDTASTESMPGPGGGGAGHHGGGRGHHGGAGGDGPRDRGGFASGEQPGDRIGPYKLLEVIGTGGFGVVYLAERREPMVQRVALKILKPGMDSHAVIARFEQERQALAVMDHPNVAKVLDGGVTGTGRPFFVMEHVKGDPITAYADRQQLTIRERLELFTSVCEAVQHAHMKGIIHRDLKPSNILVASVGERREGERSSSTGALVKVIDFGVAKAISHSLTDKTIYTEHGQLIGTPEYMSPEQAEMGSTDIDTRSDVYSLGVVLYELLCGAVPFDGKTLRAAGWGAIQRIIREEEPPRPSTRLSTIDDETGAKIARARQADREKIAAELRRELEWIPLKALRKDRARRYASAESLAADVRGYLEGQPLEAAPESRAYLMRKFLRRHRGQVLAAIAVMVALVAGGSVAAWQWREVKSQADHAREVLDSLGESTHRMRTLLDPEQWSEDEVEFIDAPVQEARIDISDKKPSELAGRDAVTVMGAFAESTIRAASVLIEKLERERDAARAAQQQAEDNARTIERNAYVANVQMAGTYRELGEWGSVRERLNAARGPHVNWEWAWLDAEADQSLLVLRHSEKPVRGVAFSPDGTRAASASQDGTVRLWNVLDGALLHTMRGHSLAVNSVAFDSTGLIIVTSSWDKTARVWDGVTGKQINVLQGHNGTVTSADFSPDGTRIATASLDGTVRVWDWMTGQSLAEFRGHSSPVRDTGFSPDGLHVISGSSEGVVCIWEVATARETLRVQAHGAPIHEVAFVADGQRFATAASENAIRIWDTSTGARKFEATEFSAPPTSAAFSPDGMRFVAARFGGHLTLWGQQTEGQPGELFGHTNHVLATAISEDGTRMLSGCADGFVRLWNIEFDGWDERDDNVDHEPQYLALGPRGLGLRTTPHGGEPQICDVTSGRVIAALRDFDGFVGCAAFSPDGQRLVTATGGGPLQMWNVENGVKRFDLTGHVAAVLAIRFSEDGSRVVTGSDDNSAIVWDVSTGRAVTGLTGHAGAVLNTAFSRDGTRIVTASSDNTARVWNAMSGESLAELKWYTDWIRSAEFSPDGTRIVTTAYEVAPRVWDASTGESLAELAVRWDPIESAAFSPDGTKIVSVSEDGTGRIWDAVPYRIRFAERYWRETGPEEMRAINLGEIYMKELRGLSEPTWLSDPTLEKYRPNFLWNPAKQDEAEAGTP